MPEILLANVDQALYNGLKREAKARGLELTELMMDALRKELQSEPGTEADTHPAETNRYAPEDDQLDLRPPPDDWFDPLAESPRRDPAWMEMLAIRRKYWDGLYSEEELEQVRKLTKRTDMGGPSPYELD